MKSEDPRSAEAGALLLRADSGDVKAQAELSRRIDDMEQVAPGWIEDEGNLSRRAENALLCAANKDFVSYETSRRVLAEKRRELAGPNPSPLERALADRLAFALAETDYLAEWRARGDEMTVAQAEHFERRYSRAHSRSMSAARTLAVVRRLATNMPAVAVQVNMGLAPRDRTPEELHQGKKDATKPR